MRRLWMLVAVLLSLSVVAKAQIGKNIGVAVGTPEDKAIAEIYAATDSAQKISLLQKFLTDYGSNPDLALLADQLLLNVYQTDKNYEKTIEYGEKVLAIDPENFTAAVTLARAAQEKGDTEKLFANGQRAVAIVQRYKAQAPPGRYGCFGLETQTRRNSEDDRSRSRLYRILDVLRCLPGAGSQAENSADGEIHFGVPGIFLRGKRRIQRGIRIPADAGYFQNAGGCGQGAGKKSE